MNFFLNLQTQGVIFYLYDNLDEAIKKQTNTL